jgi:hypothetical protein
MTDENNSNGIAIDKEWIDENTEVPEIPIKRRTANCKSCGAEMIFLNTAKGHQMPCDAATVGADDIMYDKSKGHMSHFATCPDAAQHRKGKKRN